MDLIIIIGVIIYVVYSIIKINREFDEKYNHNNKEQLKDMPTNDVYDNWITGSDGKLYRENNYGRYNYYYNRNRNRNLLKSKNGEYVNFCWRCHTLISSDKDERCPICGWYICSHCGACSSKCSRKQIKKEKI